MHNYLVIYLSVYGTGYAWNPSTLTVTSGDEVVWKWNNGGLVTSAAYRIYTLSGITSKTYDENGFRSSTTGSVNGKYYPMQGVKNPLIKV